VTENISLPLELAGEDAAVIISRVNELLQWFGLEGKANVYPSQLSGGQQQRVAIARALATKPAVLLSDEPTSALDAETTSSALELLQRVRDEMGVTILLITHELDAVRAICDRVAVLDHGTIVEEGPVEEVLLRPKSDAAQRLLGENLHIGRMAEYLGDRTAHEGSIFLELQLLGKSATDPLLSDTARALNVTISILRAEIGKLNRSAYGFLLVEISGSSASLIRAQQLLAERGAVVTPVDPWNSASEERTA
jgi:D-methionine transport system ATP-binding protein